MREERIELSQRERKVLHEVQRGHLRQREAAGRLQLSSRQVLAPGAASMSLSTSKSSLGIR